MINDEKRREIVGNLRYCAEMCDNAGVGVLDSDVLNALGIHCGDTDGVSDAYDVEKLADLIDRPTTTRHGKFKTKYGRETPCCEVCGYSIGDMRWNYCPKCGAVITDAKHEGEARGRRVPALGHVPILFRAPEKAARLHAVHEGEHNAFRPLRCALRFGQLRDRCVAKTCRPHRPPEREYRASSVSWSPALDKVLPWRASFRGYANGV